MGEVVAVRHAEPNDLDRLVELHYGDPEGETTTLLGTVDSAMAFGRAILGVRSDWDTHDVAVLDGMIVGALQHHDASRAFRPSAGFVLAIIRRLGTKTFVALHRGLAVMSVQLSVPADCWHIAELHVDPSMRGRGIGTVLLQHAEKTAQSEGHVSLGLTTRTNNRARRLYERLGYAVVGTRTSRRYERLTGAAGRVLMTKDLVASL